MAENDSELLNTVYREISERLGMNASMDQTPLQEVSYPVIVISFPDGTMQFDVPDFPAVKFSGTDMPQGLQYIKERLQDEKLISIFPPTPTPPNQITLQPGQFLLQIPV